MACAKDAARCAGMTQTDEGSLILNARPSVICAVMEAIVPVIATYFVVSAARTTNH